MGPGLDLLMKRKCVACGSSGRRVFNVDNSRLRDYALIYRLCRYCWDRLESLHGYAPSHWPFYVINAHGEPTMRARRADIADGLETRKAALAASDPAP